MRMLFRYRMHSWVVERGAFKRKVNAMATGVMFGYLPARKAARLTPVAALARE